MNSPKPLSLQRRWQLQRKAQGLCTHCGKASRPGLTQCQKCSDTSNRSDIKHLWKIISPDQWRTLDWTQTNTELAQQTGKTTLWISKQRRRYAVTLQQAA